MVTQHSKKRIINGFEVGDSVTVKVDKVNRAGRPQDRLFGRVAEITKSGLYGIKTTFGVMKQLVDASQLATYRGNFSMPFKHTKPGSGLA